MRLSPGSEATPEKPITRESMRENGTAKGKGKDRAKGRDTEPGRRHPAWGGDKKEYASLTMHRHRETNKKAMIREGKRKLGESNDGSRCKKN